MDSPRAENAAYGWGCLVVFALIGVGLVRIHNTVWGEREGSIKTDDCRAKITVKEGSSETWFKKFTCVYQKTKSGKILSGYCEAVDTNTAGICETVYFYEKQASLVCSSSLMPYLGEDDRCHADPR